MQQLVIVPPGYRLLLADIATLAAERDRLADSLPAHERVRRPRSRRTRYQEVVEALAPFEGAPLEVLSEGVG